ncbi:MAG: starch-binding protein [Ruminococcaceae bacterium]|nr:starch-binding protein [Oscillospiraceae bacterium]
MKKLLSVLLAFCMLFSVVIISDEHHCTHVDTAYGLVDNVQDGQILQCWNWSFENMRKNMALIASQGFSAVQTSPIQGSKESTKEYYSTMQNSWWVYYQPINFNIETNSYNALGTSAEFKTMCDEAEKYGIKVIVDAVLNHTANQNQGNTISNLVPDDLKYDSSCWHDITKDSWYESRWDITQFCMGGIPDLNTGNAKVQQYAISFLKECIDAGADGFRFDGAKHIEVPTDFDYASDFWPNVLNATTEYAKSTKGFTPYYYGEILDGPSGSNDRSNAQMTLNTYMSLMSVTQSTVSADILNGVVYNNAGAAAKSDFYFSDGSCSLGDKTVLWNESHDTYIHGGTGGYSTVQMNKTWALVGSRNQAAGMYMARPASNQDKLGTAGITAWANPEVKAVNQFKNKFVGQSEYLSVSGSIAINERGTSGAILVNCGGTNASVNVKANMLSNGTYIDAITGNTFKVSNGYISGNIGSTGIAVITREGDALPSTPSLPTGEATIYFDNSSYNWSSVYAYVYNDATENSAWPGVKMSYDSASGYYKLHLDGTLAYGKVIFAESSTASTNRYPSDGVEGLDIGGKDMLFSKNHTWTEYVPTEEPSEEPSEEPALPTGTATIYFDDSSYKWSTIYAYVYVDSTENAAWPGVLMTYDESTGYYKMDLDGVLAYGKVIFTKSKYATTNRYPADGVEGLDIGGKDMLFSENHTWAKYVPSENSSEEPSSEVNTDGTEYVINTKTKKVHLPSCRYATSANTESYYGDLQTLLDQGYALCNTCKPDQAEESSEIPSEEPSSEVNTDGTEYVINRSTKKIHLPSCRYATSANTESYYGDLQTLLDQGYALCNTCKPDQAGDSSEAPSEEPSSEEPSSEVNTDGTEYVINTKTKKVHLPSCRYATSANTESYYGDLQTLLDQGYALCNTCKPDQAGDSSEAPSEEPSSESPALPTGTATIYFDDSSYKWSTIYAYVYVDSTENAAWPGVLMTYDESTGYYKMDLDGVLAYGKVIFTKSKYATTNRYPADGVEGLDIGGKDMLFSENHTWAKYVPSENSSEEPSSEVNTDGTEYVINTKTKKIHLPSCRYATSANTESYYGDLQALLDQGYALCNTCKPAQSGDSSETPSEDPSEGVTPDGTEFTLNTKTKKIHLSTCRYAKSTSSNITKYYGATKTLIEQGYTLCAKCKPEQTEESSTPPSDSTSENPLIPTNSKYYVEGKLLFGVSEKTTASTLLSAFASNELSVYDSNGNAVSGDDIVGTGYCIRYIKDGKIVDYLEIIIKGDIDGNGVVDSTDYLRVKQEWLNRIISSDVYEIAADIDNNGVIDSTDYLRIKSHFSGTYDLYA